MGSSNRNLLAWVCATYFVTCCVVRASAAAVDYAKDVQPILQARCYECHGPEKHKNGFRADSKTHAFQGGDSGEKAIIPGDPEHSHLLKLVRGDDPDNVMPPKGERLT